MRVSYYGVVDTQMRIGRARSHLAIAFDFVGKSKAVIVEGGELEVVSDEK